MSSHTITGFAVFAVALALQTARAGVEIAQSPTKSFLLTGKERVSDAELAGMRGGFFVAAGAQFDFGASIQTLVNGQLVLQTTLNWTPTGVALQQLVGGGSQNGGPTVSIPTVSQQPISVVQVKGQDGTTSVMAGVNPIQNLVVNSASGQMISQNTNITFTIYNFADWQRQLSGNGVALQLGRELLAGTPSLIQ